MSKALKAVVGLGFTGAAGTAGVTSYIYMTSGETIRDKFSVALIKTDATDDVIWNKKWKKLRESSAQVHSNNSKLKEVKQKSATAEANDEIKRLMKEGCTEIYNSKFVSEDDNNFKDFKAYCSLWFEDRLQNFITDAVTNTGGGGSSNSNKWDAKLTTLGDYKKNLDKELDDIKNNRKGSDNNAKKTAIKAWCDKQKVEILEKEGSDRRVNIQDFCIE